MSPKKTKRKNVKNASLKKNYNSRIRQEYIDLDYIEKLDNTKKNCKLPNGKMVTELEYMTIFMQEWNNSEVGKQKDAKKNQIQRTPEAVKDSTDRNNSRNRDQYSMAKAQNKMSKHDYNTIKDYIENEKHFSKDYVEDSMIEYLDKMKDLSKSRNKGED